MQNRVEKIKMRLNRIKTLLKIQIKDTLNS